MGSRRLSPRYFRFLCPRSCRSYDRRRQRLPRARTQTESTGEGSGRTVHAPAQYPTEAPPRLAVMADNPDRSGRSFIVPRNPAPRSRLRDRPRAAGVKTRGPRSPRRRQPRAWLKALGAELGLQRPCMKSGSPIGAVVGCVQGVRAQRKPGQRVCGVWDWRQVGSVGVANWPPRTTLRGSAQEAHHCVTASGTASSVVRAQSVQSV
jgi:hypothetical protein